MDSIVDCTIGETGEILDELEPGKGALGYGGAGSCHVPLDGVDEELDDKPEQPEKEAESLRRSWDLRCEVEEERFEFGMLGKHRIGGLLLGDIGDAANCASGEGRLDPDAVGS